MEYKVQFKPKAVEDLEAIVEFYDQQSTTAFAKVYAAIIKRAELLTTLPDRGRVPPEFRDEGISKYRELIEGYFRIVYRYEGRVVTIIRILDSRSLSDLQAEHTN
jgi:plasmid stabilization system protein ParE